MISIDTILSLFNDKGTLLQWLKKVEGALNGATLTNVTINQLNSSTIQLDFNFEDGTKVTSDIINLPQGAQGVPGKDGAQGVPGKDGISIKSITAEDSYIAGDFTVTPLDIVYTDNTSVNVSVKAKNGAQGTEGAEGVGVTGFGVGGSRVSGDYTITDVSAFLSDGSEHKLMIKAKNGAQGIQGTQGEKGNGVVSITTIGYTEGTGQYEGYTATNINLDTDEETLPFIVYAKNGKDGAQPQAYLQQQNIFCYFTETDDDFIVTFNCSILEEYKGNTPLTPWNAENFKNYLENLPTETFITVTGYVNIGGIPYPLIGVNKTTVSNRTQISVEWLENVLHKQKGLLLENLTYADSTVVPIFQRNE